MKQSEILFYARRHCSEMEYQFKKMYEEAPSDELLEERNKWHEKWLELDKALVNEWNKETKE